MKLLALFFLVVLSRAYATYTSTTGTYGVLFMGTPDSAAFSSYVMRFRLLAYSATPNYFIFHGNQANNGYGAYIDGSGNWFVVAAGQQTVQLSGTLALNTWYTVVLVRRNTAVAVFCSNGVSGQTNAIVNNPTDGFWAGASYPTSTHFGIDIAEAAYFQRELSSGERNALFNYLRPLNLGGPKYYWPLVNVLNDVCGGQNMTIVGTGVTATTHPPVYN